MAKAAVVTAIDRFQDLLPSAPTQVPFEEEVGNRVFVGLGDGRCSLYASSNLAA